MAYRFASERGDYSAFASGQVLHSLPGQTAFPVRLASEIFQRCAARLAQAGEQGPYALYDPCCGGAQLLVTLAFLHGEALRSVVGSDADPEAVRLAERNLALLTPQGVDARIAALRALHERYAKASHAEAAAHAVTLRERLAELTRHQPIETRVFCADTTDPAALRRYLPPHGVELVIADVPYGQRSSWRGAATDSAEDSSPVWHLLEALRAVVSSRSIVAIAANKDQKVRHERYRPLERFHLGKRHAVLLTPAA